MKVAKGSLDQWLESKIVHPHQIAKWREQLHADNKTVATLNGSFDLMHSGHLHILFEASKQADVLILGLNTDESIRQYKSSKRPIIALKDRLAIMAALSFVDYVSYFEQTTPNEWLLKILPDVHVNGAEYGYECVEASTLKQIGARLHLVDRIEGLATSQIIEKIRRL